jgi:hypothetical protein
VGDAPFELDDLSTDEGVELYRVRPTFRPAVAGILYLHWFDESPTANRGQVLEEAGEMAGLGVVSALPQLTFPWHDPPRDAEHDLARIEVERRRLREAFGLLVGAGVEPDRVAVVGHDFGAMHGALLVSEVAAACAVFIAATPRWSDWFLRFWRIDTDRYDYMRALEPVDPSTTIASARCPLLFQFGSRDFYIAGMTGSELYRAAPEPKDVIHYDTGHEMADEEVRRDRIRYLIGHLGLDEG